MRKELESNICIGLVQRLIHIASPAADQNHAAPKERVEEAVVGGGTESGDRGVVVVISDLKCERNNQTPVRPGEEFGCDKTAASHGRDFCKPVSHPFIIISVADRTSVRIKLILYVITFRGWQQVPRLCHVRKDQHYMFESCVSDVMACGLWLESCVSDVMACGLWLESCVSDLMACGLWFVVCYLEI
ncbi:hypothetical protein RRG08_001648 [Elysia crispata]|uniref:Uncharacterized protein n=1 Tax=Elysia crispata TaxID=231223 RepID=A0AAE1AKF1_9GAST|nr:hypothetical protein RRG08_001648 [Elysia crispata]